MQASLMFVLMATNNSNIKTRRHCIISLKQSLIPTIFFLLVQIIDQGHDGHWPILFFHLIVCNTQMVKEITSVFFMPVLVEQYRG